MFGRYSSPWNNAEFGAPPTSARGQAYAGAIVGSRVVYRAPSVGQAHTIKHYDLFGAVATRPAINRTVYALGAYNGIFPLGEQPMIRRPNPWSDPTRGAP